METYDMLHIFTDPIVPVVGEAVAGEAAAMLKQIKSLVKDLTTNTFDLAIALLKVKKNKYYQQKFNTFSEYIETLDIKVSKCYYLVKLVDVMEQCKIDRTVYEPVGLAKLRIITRVKVIDDEGKPTTFEGVPVSLLVKDMVDKASTWTPEALDLRVKQIQGLVGDNASAGWINFPVTYAQKAAWERAVKLGMMNIGSVGKDENTGQFKDASLGAVAEVIATNYWQDPNSHPEGWNEETEDVPDDQVGGELVGGVSGTPEGLDATIYGDEPAQ
jgi:peroxiredoxin family protein